MIDRVEDTKSFKKLGQEWNELLQASDSDGLFLTWEWLYTWWKHLSGGKRLRILTLRRGAELIAIAPFVVRPPSLRRLSPFRSVEFLGSGIVGSDYLDLIIKRGHERETLEVLAEYLARQKLMLDLGQLRGGLSHALALACKLGQQGWRLSKTRAGVCPFIPLFGLSWESYLATLGPAHRYNFKRRLKNLTKLFEVRLEQARSEGQRRDALAVLVSLHEMRWRQKGGRGAFFTSALRSFHEEITRIALERGWLRLFVLLLDGKPAASIYGFRYGHTFLFYQSGFDPGYTKHSVGLIAMGLAIKSAIEEGLEEYDFLHGDESYKFLWARATRELERVALYPPRVRGLLYSRAMECSRLSRRTARRLLGDALADRITGG